MQSDQVDAAAVPAQQGLIGSDHAGGGGDSAGGGVPISNNSNAPLLRASVVPSVKQVASGARSPLSNANDATSLDPFLLDGTDAPSKQSLITLWLMNVFVFVTAVIWSTIGLVVLPSEAVRLSPQNSSLYLGFLCALVALSQCSCPIVGLLSDRHRSHYGKRRPYILGGSALAILGISGMWHSSLGSKRSAYAISLFFAQIGLNTCYSAQAAIVPDMCGESCRGETSGIVGVLQFSGNLAGMLFVIATRKGEVQHMYPVYQLLLAAACGIICLSARERPTHLLPPAPALSFTTVRRAFSVDPVAEADFFWVVTGRAFYYGCTSLQLFTFYFVRDCLGFREDSEVRRIVAELVIGAMGAALLTSYPLGRMSDQVGRKKMIYAAVILMSASYAGYAAAPGAIASRLTRLNVVRLCSVTYGVGMGCYLAVDYALALDCLPWGRGSAEALGLWGVAGFFGSGLGPFLGGLVLSIRGGGSVGGALFGSSPNSENTSNIVEIGYNYEGYVGMLTIGVVSAMCVGVLTYPIKGTK